MKKAGPGRVELLDDNDPKYQTQKYLDLIRPPKYKAGDAITYNKVIGTVVQSINDKDYVQWYCYGHRYIISLPKIRENFSVPESAL